MAKLKTYDVRADKALMTALTSKASGITHEYFKDSTSRTLKAIDMYSDLPPERRPPPK